MAGEVPSVNPNALGAPAEGLGQTVTFAFDPSGAPPQKKVTASGGPRIGVQGVSSPELQRSREVKPPPPDPTATFLMKAASDTLNKKVDEARTQQFMQGMQRAMSGEAVTEIQASQPWYSKIWGDTPMVEGARVYQAQDTVNKIVAQQTANMSKLETMSADEASRHFAGVFKTATATGDGGTDAIVGKQLMESMPALMKAQAKSHYAWGQRNAMSSMTSSITSGAGGLQEFGQMYAEQKVSDADMAQRKQQFVLSALPPAGIDEDSYQKALTGSVQDMARKGQFHAIEALKEAGIMRALTPEQANRVEASITSEATRNRDRYAVSFAPLLAEIKSDARDPKEGSTVRDLDKRIDQANAAYQKLTGNPQPFITADQKADLLAQNFSAFKQAQKEVANAQAVQASKQATANDKAAADAIIQGKVSEYVANGDWDKAKVLGGGVTNDQVDRTIYEFVKGNLPASAGFLKTGYVKGSVSRLVQNDVQRPWREAQGSFTPGGVTVPPESFYQAIQLYRTFSQTDPKMAQAYFGEHAKEVATASNLLGADIMSPQSVEVYNAVMGGKLQRPAPADKKTKDALVKNVVKEGSGFMPAWMGGYALRPDAVAAISAGVSDLFEDWRATGLSDQEAMVRATNEYLGPDRGDGRAGGARGEILGGYFIERSLTSDGVPLGTLMNGRYPVYTEVPENIKNDVFSNFLNDPAGVGLPPSQQTTRIFRSGDTAGGWQNFSVMSTDKNGAVVVRNFTENQLAQYASNKTHWKRLGFNGGTRDLTTQEAQSYSDEFKRNSQPVPLPSVQFGSAVTYTPENYRKGVEILQKQAEQLRKSNK